MNRQEKALDYFGKKFNCSQAVFAVFAKESGLSEDDCLRISCAFGGGMGRQQYTCGAVTGALMVIGLKYGKALNDPHEKKIETYLKTQEFFKRFEQLNSSINCKVLLDGLDMNNPDDHKIIMERKLFDIKCGKYVTDAVSILETI